MINEAKPAFLMGLVGSGRGKLSHLPKPLDYDVVGAVAVLVLGVLSPVVHVHVPQATHEQLWRTGRRRLHIWTRGERVWLFDSAGGLTTHLQLVLIKDLDQIHWYQLKEALTTQKMHI